MKKLRDIVEDRNWKAQEGESEVLYHTSGSNFDQFKPFSHFGSKQAAGQRLHTKGLFDRFKTYSVRLKLGNVAHIDYDSHSHYPTDIIHGLHEYNHITDDEHKHLYQKFKDSEKNSDWSTDEKFKYLGKFLNKKGIDTISYRNDIEDPGSKSYINTRSDQVRILHKGYHVNQKKYPHYV